MNILFTLFLSILLFVIAYIDYKTQEINIIALFAMLLGGIAILIFTKDINIKDMIFGGTLAIVPYLIMVITSKGGFGDVLLMGVLGLLLGSRGIVSVILLSGLCYLIFSFYKIYQYTNKEKRTIKEGMRLQFPYAPFVFMGWILHIIITFAL